MTTINSQIHKKMHKENVKIEERKNSGMSKVKKKITEKDQRESTCQRKKKREVGNNYQVIKKPSVKM